MNMKKFIVCLLVICICAGAIAGCGGSKIPDEMSEGVYNCGVKTVEVIDQFLKADLTIDEASEKLDALYEQAKALSQDEKKMDFNVYINIGNVERIVKNLTKSTHIKTSSDDVVEAKDELIKLLEIN